MEHVSEKEHNKQCLVCLKVMLLKGRQCLQKMLQVFRREAVQLCVSHVKVVGDSGGEDCTQEGAAGGARGEAEESVREKPGACVQEAGQASDDAQPPCAQGKCSAEQ